VPLAYTYSSSALDTAGFNWASSLRSWDTSASSARMQSVLSLCGTSSIGIPHDGHTDGGTGKGTFACPGVPSKQQAACRSECGAFLRRGVCADVTEQQTSALRFGGHADCKAKGARAERRAVHLLEQLGFVEQGEIATTNCEICSGMPTSAPRRAISAQRRRPASAP
jgi:hypothetical protein